MRRALLAILTVLVVAACSADPYPLPSAPGASSSHPAALETPIRGVVLYLTPRPGDTIEILGADPVGVVPGADVRFYLSRPVVEPNGDRVIGDQLEPLSGGVISTDASASPGPQNSVGIVAEITVHRAGDYKLTGVRLHYRLNGRAERVGEGIDEVFTICAATPAPSTCQ